MHVTLAQSIASTMFAGWLMIRAGAAKKQLRIRRPGRCGSCGRLRTARGCPCTDGNS